MQTPVKLHQKNECIICSCSSFYIPKPANEFGTKPAQSSAALRFVLPSSQINATLNGYQLITNISAVLLGFRQENSFNGVLQLLIGCKNYILLPDTRFQQSDSAWQSHDPPIKHCICGGE